jgi:hypothetical protein
MENIKCQAKVDINLILDIKENIKLNLTLTWVISMSRKKVDIDI